MKQMKCMVYAGIFVGLILCSCSVTKRVGDIDDHVENIKERGLLVRLDRDLARLASMEKYGKTEKLDSRKQQVEESIDEFVDAMKTLYDFSDVYFYYADDADAVIKNKDLSLIYEDANTKAVDISWKAAPYVLKFGSRTSYNKSRLEVYSWDYKRIRPIEQMTYPNVFNTNKQVRILLVGALLTKLTMEYDIPSLVEEMNKDFHRTSNYRQ